MGHGRSRLLLVLLLGAFFAPTVGRGEVLFAHDNALEAGIRPTAPPERISNRKFADQSSIFLPEIHHHLRGDAAGWISTWNPYPELGRPTNHVSSFSKAYHLTHVLSFLTDDPFRVYTWLTIAAVVLTGLFGFLLLESLGLHPSVCFAGGVAFGLGTFVAYWLTFVLFVWGICWTLALLWLVTGYLRRPGLGRGVGIAFAVHSLLLSGYPQQIVWHGYLVLGYVAWRLVRGGHDLRTAATRALGLATCALVGLATVAPVYLDLAFDAGRSARTDPEPSFFLAVLPPLEGWRDLGLFAGKLFDAFWLGDPIRPDYPVRFNGLSLGPVWAALLAASLGALRCRQLWPAWLFVFVALLANVWPGLYRFGVEHLLLDISRFNPFAGAWIPALVLGAYAADEALRGGPWVRRLGPWLAVAAALPAVIGLLAGGHELHAGFVVLGSLLLAGGVGFLLFPRPWLLVLLAVLPGLFYAGRLVLARPADSIHLSSPLIELVRREAGGARVAWVDKRPGMPLPPNQEALMQVPSIHTYNSLSSRSYQRWVERISERGTQTYGRYFLSVTGTRRLFGPELSYAGIGLLLSTAPLPAEHTTALADGVFRPRQAPFMEAQVQAFRREGDGARIAGALDAAGLLSVRREDGHDDLLRFSVAPSARETLLFVSQEHHPRWRATADGRRAETVVVNDFYQGVVVPADTREVELRFRPRAAWAWAPQALFAVAGLLLLARRLSRPAA